MHNKLLPILFSLLLAITFINAANASKLPRSEAVPGGLVVIDLGITTNDTDGKTPVALYNKQRIMVVNNNGAWHGIVGIPLSAESGKHQLLIKAQNKTVDFSVQAKAYAEQHITIKDKRKVNPNAEDMKRIRREKKRSTKALKSWRENANVDTEFTIPATGELSSPFGLKRFFNEQPRKPHSGIDIAAPVGTPIVAPASGRIIESGDFFFNGNSVFIDHGQGLITMYCHMNEINVKPGQEVAKGEKIGTIGKTGRVTGPHLHWSISLNNARIDPRLFFENLELQVNESNKMKNM